MQTPVLVFLLVVASALSLHAEAPITALALSPDNQQVVLGSQRGIEIRSWPGLVATASLPTELIHVHDLRFAPNGKTLLAAGGSPAEQGAVEVLSWPEGKQLHRVILHDDVVYRVAWSLDGVQFATAGADGICNVVALQSGKSLARYNGHSRAVLSLAYLPDGRTIVSVGVDQSLRLWDSVNGEHLRTLDNHVGAVNGVAVRPDSIMIESEQASRSDSVRASPVIATISEDRTVRLWQPTIGRLVRFARLPSTPRTLEWSTTDDRLFVGCNDGHVRILDTDSLEVVDDLEGFAGRIHEIVVDLATKKILIAGESGCRIVPFDR